MEQEKISGNIIDFKVLGRILTFVRPYKGIFILVVFLTFASAFLGPVRPYLISKTIDQDVAVGNYQGLVNMIMILLSLLIFHAMVQYFHTNSTTR